MTLFMPEKFSIMLLSSDEKMAYYVFKKMQIYFQEFATTFFTQ